MASTPNNLWIRIVIYTDTIQNEPIMRNVFIKVFFASLFLFAATALSGQDSEEWGLASYYSDDFHGRETAYGVVYDKNKLTAAHKRHPNGARLRVTRLDNNKSVVVTVIDKGPYIKGRVVDLSMAAAQQLGIVEDGVAEVKVEVVGRTSAKPEPAKKPEEVTAATTPRERTPTSFETEGARKTESKPAESKPAAPELKERASGTRTPATINRARLVREDFQKYGLYRIVLERPEFIGYGIQVASLENYENVFRQVADLQAKWFDNILVSIEPSFEKPAYKVILGPFPTEAAADTYRKSLASKHKIKGFVVNLSEIQY